MYVCMYVCVYVCMCVCVYVCMCACVYMCMYVYVCMYVCMYACMHTCMHVCMYVRSVELQCCQPAQSAKEGTETEGRHLQCMETLATHHNRTCHIAHAGPTDDAITYALVPISFGNTASRRSHCDQHRPWLSFEWFLSYCRCVGPCYEDRRLDCRAHGRFA